MRSTQRSRVQQQNRRQNNPVSYNTRLSPSQPSIPRVARGKDIIVEDVLGTVGFTPKQYILNPKFASSFPSASLSAQRYDMYEFEELEFRYHPTRAVTNTPGVVFLGWEPNANRGTPAGVKEINAYEYHTEGPAYNPNIILRVGRAHLPPPRYCRDGPTSSDLNLYDTGSLIVATDAFEGSLSPVGYIEVHYKIRFYNYHLDDSRPKQNRLLAITQQVQPIPSANNSANVLFDTSDVEEGSEWVTVRGIDGGFNFAKGKYLFQWNVSAEGGNTVARVDTSIRVNGVPAEFDSMLTPVGGGRQNMTMNVVLTLEPTDVVTLMWLATQTDVLLQKGLVTLTILN